MRSVELHLDAAGHVEDLHLDGAARGTPVNAFLLLTAVPTDPPSGHIMAFGNSEKIGTLLMNFWRHSVGKDPAGARMIEQVARDIIASADSVRGGRWPDGTVGTA